MQNTVIIYTSCSEIYVHVEWDVEKSSATISTSIIKM